MKIAEIVCVALSLLAIALNLSGVPGGNLLLIISAGSLTLINLISAFRFYSNLSVPGSTITELNATQRYLAYATGYGSALVALATVFILQYWPNGKVMSITGFGTVAVAAAILLYQYNQTRLPFYKALLVRAVLYAAVGAFLAFTPTEAIIKAKYGKSPFYPAYSEAVEKLNADPKNKALQEAKKQAWVNLLRTYYYQDSVERENAVRR